MRSKVTVVLLFLNVVLFCYIYYYDQPQIRDRELREASHSVLPPEIASMDSLTRTNRTGESFRIQKKVDASWWLTAPYEWPANTNAVSLIHNELQFLKNITSFAVADLAKTGQTLADYGLADPAYTVEFTATGNPKPYKLLIGDDTKSGNRLYVLSPGGDRVHVVSRSLADSIGLPLSEIRADSIFTIPVFEVRSLNIQTAAPSNLKVRVRRDAAARWAFESPILARAAKNNVEVAINALNALSAKDFLEPRDTDLDRTGLNAPTLRVTLEGNARRETLLLGNPTATPGEFYAKIEDKSVVFTAPVPAKLLRDLQRSQETLRDPRVADFDLPTVRSVVISAPGQPEISLQKLEPTTTASAPTTSSDSAAKDSDSWQVVTRTAGQTPVTLAGDTAIITDLLTKIHLLSARRTTLPNSNEENYGFLSDAPSAADTENYGFNRPEREITLGLSSGGGPQGNEPITLVLQIGVSPDKAGQAFARLTNPPFVYEILPDILQETPPAALSYRQRLLRTLPEGALITSFSLINLGTGQPLIAKKLNEGDKNWDAALAPEPEATRKAITGLLNQLAMLRAQRFTADTFSPDQADTAQGPRPWRYRLDYTIAFNGEAAQGTPASLLLTERLGGMTQLAGTTEFGGVVFSVTQEMLDALFALTYGAQHDPGPPAPVTPAPVVTPVEPPAKP